MRAGWYRADKLGEYRSAEGSWRCKWGCKDQRMSLSPLFTCLFNQRPRQEASPHNSAVPMATPLLIVAQLLTELFREKGRGGDKHVCVCLWVCGFVCGCVLCMSVCMCECLQYFVCNVPVFVHLIHIVVVLLYISVHVLCIVRVVFWHSLCSGRVLDPTRWPYWQRTDNKVPGKQTRQQTSVNTTHKHTQQGIPNHLRPFLNLTERNIQHCKGFWETEKTDINEHKQTQNTWQVQSLQVISQL